MNKIEKGPAFWKAFGQAAALWAAVAVAVCCCPAEA